MVDSAKYAQILKTRRQELTARVDVVEDRLDDPVSPDFSDQAIEREEDEVLEDLGHAADVELRLIDDALRRIDHGTFGICLSCGEEISDARLEAVPHAALCRHCMQK